MTRAAGLTRLERDRDAADESAAAHGDDDGVEVRHLLDQLEADGALAGDHARVVEGMDEDETALGLDLPGARIGRVVVVAVEDDLGAVAARRRHLASAAPTPASRSRMRCRGARRGRRRPSP